MAGIKKQIKQDRKKFKPFYKFWAAHKYRNK